MEVKESESKVIAKPLASRPSCSNVKTFTEVMPDSVTLSPQSNCHDASMFKQPAALSVPSPKVEERNGKGKSCDVSESRNYVVYKPKAQLVSQATISLLANMVNHQHTWRQTEAVATVKRVSQGTHGVGPNLIPRVPSFTESATTDRSSVDGYKWKKYGQKQVKGSESPRSYYRCTHPKCPVKKRVERSMRGQVSEIVYQGEHNHFKPSFPPLPPRASSSGSQNPPKEQDPNNLYYHQSNESSKSITEKMNEGCVVAANSTGGTWDSGSRNSQCDEGGLDDQSRSKRSRKNEKQSSEAQSSGESESLEDGFKWRKYGQKAVGGSAYPRSYYRCTSVNCRARKRVERASDDPRAFITTYEGRHNHHHLQMSPPTSSTLPTTF